MARMAWGRGKAWSVVGVTLAALAAATPSLAVNELEPSSPELLNTSPLFKLQQVGAGFAMPLLVTNADDGTNRVFVVEQGGRVWTLAGGVRTLYLDVAFKVLCCGERGLLGLAFHPNFENNGQLFISYTRPGDGMLTIERLTVANPPLGSPPTSGTILIQQAHNQFGNHNGGGIGFGPDGKLYIAWGDGGGGGDPLNSGQNKNTLLGKMLRIDVDNPDPGRNYGIPADNPFVGQAGARGEIWSYGLRNPWRWSFDRDTGDLYIADVGQNLNEEVNFQLAGAAGGQNYGWNAWEGHLLFTGGLGNVLGSIGPNLVFPFTEYLHGPHCSVTGGYVYRGPSVPTLEGVYFYGDFCSGVLWGGFGAAGARVGVPLIDTPFTISSFGEDEAGDVYVVNYGGGAIFRFAPP